MTDGEIEDASARRGSAADAAEPVADDRADRESDDVEPERASSSGGPNWVRILVASAAVLTLLLLGAAAGMLIGLPGAANRAAPPADSVDVGFAQDMSVHHRQATQMATLYRANGTQDDILTLAFDIDTNQRAQIGWMQGWLNLWDRPLNPPGEYMAWMSEGGGHGHGGAEPGASPEEAMPGMASQEELERLRSLRGTELDIFFLQLMLRHHEGGTEMAAYAAERAAIPQVSNLASNMLNHQTAESRKMTGMLSDLGAEPLPFEG
ncbi:DUF305 domain-containing protein [Actinoalloteichus hymeniacidonis]|uniref:DUF305 domain-containing protein n=1 Tax=Actinoalloteichus hymeniacidonis TaxID=340345 RepID=A0AAC9HMU3_9PSEU|nr:DUF305 domain-containing protein [Actinoalloteichus hymeniacidonis]AOS62262.1 hypothetical protein TL08_07220 [Actinoalloteichus hymeniacidonis]MBB5909712.1 uncharacterized protein (DUF305 family) [Actinoalloteichus hymeniacidonis]